MEYYDPVMSRANAGQESMSLQDMIECDMQSPPMEQHMMGSHDNPVSEYAPSEALPQNVLVNMWPQSHPTHDSLSWVNSVDMSNFQQLSGDGRTVIMVDPQTGLPQEAQPPPYNLHSFDSPPRAIRQSTAQNLSLHPPPMYSQQRQPHLHGPPIPHLSRQHIPQAQQPQPKPGESKWEKPAYSYSCLIAMALKNSKSGSLPVSDIYNFMIENFPYFKTAPSGWKNSVRHNLSLNKCFAKIERPTGHGNSRKGCLWAMNPAKIEKMDEECLKWRKKDAAAIKRAMANPDKLELIEKGICRSPSPVSQHTPPQTILGEIKAEPLMEHGSYTADAELFDPTLADINMKSHCWSDAQEPGDFSPGQDQAVPSGIPHTTIAQSVPYDISQTAVSGTYVYTQNYNTNNNTKLYTDNSSHGELYIGNKPVALI
ncbi:PREDICTED: forkhead box protein N4-like isoform X2 [Priapulus caudatus]|uniref:Forkhead box protein N4-like isoform X2 n=1 Tax=Priapulus caudatus TaxID=37621 RepID=A0ABM1FAL4_PRICU|nr:PREDICTED: forkhead box protein N4-like isoform X2 [Priapulus caudatus]